MIPVNVLTAEHKTEVARHLRRRAERHEAAAADERALADTLDPRPPPSLSPMVPPLGSSFLPAGMVTRGQRIWWQDAWWLVTSGDVRVPAHTVHLVVTRDSLAGDIYCKHDDLFAVEKK